MGVGKTVYKGEVETGVFAWFLSSTDLMPVIMNCAIPVGASLLAMREYQSTVKPPDTPPSRASSLPQLLAPKLTQIDDI
ncbi:hypothetical protein CUN61_03680 [Pseudomonas arsenicoxydans]|uniref:Uncharacterized protein n=1 Tax=Pseudomonas arsenicoxydans TaxID=702115 RepID=A0A4P6G1F3_9PSED|nr:hypothetical protein CUN61_03680 [Pseudomonas arsenicoxydans]